METYKRKINLRHFAPQSGTEKDIVVSDAISFLPHYSGETEYPIKWETYNHYMKWLERFIIDSSIYAVRKRNEEFVLIDAREYDEEYVNSGVSFTEQWEILKRWFCDELCGVYASEYDAKVSATDECCENNGKVFVNPNANEFFEMFATLENACALLNSDAVSGMTQTIDIPIYISSDIEDLGMFDNYDFEKASAYTEDELAEILEMSAVCEYDIASGDTVYVESQLKTLLRAKKNYDDDGNVLPYYYNESAEPTRNELPYAFRIPCDVTYSDGIVSYNVLMNIYYYNEGSDEINSAATDKTYYDGSMQTSGTIEFVYLVGATCDENGDYVEGSGIEYHEKRAYEKQGVSNGDAIIVSDYTVDNPEDYDSTKQYARVEFDGSCEMVYRNGHLIKNDALMSIQDAKLNTDNVHIDRGTSAAYEAFNVLGETNTIEDIENYRDDWYRIRGKND